MLMPTCSICGEPCSLDDCKIDERGRAVHEKCIVDKLTGKKDAKRPKRNS